MVQQSNNDEQKSEWVKPAMTVIATEQDIHGGIIDDDEDFTGNPS